MRDREIVKKTDRETDRQTEIGRLREIERENEFSFRSDFDSQP